MTDVASDAGGGRRDLTTDEAVPPADAGTSPPTGRIAYLVSRYPRLSHAFIEREVRALRELGWEVDTYSVNPPAPQDLRTRAAREEAARTTALLSSRWTVLLRNVRFSVRHPRAWTTGLVAALRSGAPRAGHRLWQVFYLLEAVFLVEHLRRDGHRHLHVHFADNGADVARLVVILGRILDGPSWRWSLSMHGPTELLDVVGHDLAAKLRSASFVACISHWLEHRLLQIAGPAFAPKLALVRMSVEPDRYRPGAEQRFDRTGPMHVLFVGRLVPEKGLGLLVDAVARLHRRQTGVRLTVVGTGPLEASLREQVSRLGLSDVVELVGPRGQEELPSLYAEADVFCLPSFDEGLPVVLLEALSTELPVVTTRITGIPELVQDGTNGLLVEPGDVSQLALALATLAGDAGLRHRLGRAGRRRVMDEFLPEPNARRLAGLFARATLTTQEASDDDGPRNATPPPISARTADGD